MAAAAAGSPKSPQAFNFKEVAKEDAPALKQTLYGWGDAISKMQTAAEESPGDIATWRKYDDYLSLRKTEYWAVVALVERRAQKGVVKEQSLGESLEFRLIAAYDADNNLCSLSDFTVYKSGKIFVRHIIKNPAHLRPDLNAHPKVRGVATAQIDYIKQIALDTNSTIKTQPDQDNVQFYRAKGFKIEENLGQEKGAAFKAQWPNK